MVTWNELTVFEQAHLKAFNDDPHSVSSRRSSQALENKELIKWGWETGYTLTPLGREVLAQATPQPQPATAPTAGGAGEADADMRTDRALYNLVKTLMAELKFAEAIRTVRDQYPVGLAVARDFVESVKDGGQFPVKMQAERLQSDLATLRAENRRLVSELAAVRVERDAMRAALQDYRGTVGLVDRMLDNMIYNLSSMPKEPLSSAITGLKNVKEYTSALHAKMRAAALKGDQS